MVNPNASAYVERSMPEVREPVPAVPGSSSGSLSSIDGRVRR